jgi:putative SOS response-associated peptidase YedK
MCGRFTQAYSWQEVRAFLDLKGPARNLRPRYNIAPTTMIDVAMPCVGGPSLVPMRWGLIPSWWKKPLNELPPTFNARAETVAEKPMFRSAFKSRRCIIPASGFYEWTGSKGAKTPHYFSSPSGEPLAFAGLWESWREPESGETILSATIIVSAANEWMKRYHDRAPVMLEKKDFDLWLSGDPRLASGSGNPASLLRPAREDSMREWVVSSRVNRSGVGDDDPTLIEADAVTLAKTGFNIAEH